MRQQATNFLFLLVPNSDIFEDRDNHFRAHFDCNNKEQFKIKLVNKSGLFYLLLVELLYIFVQFLDGGIFLGRLKEEWKPKFDEEEDGGVKKLSGEGKERPW